MEIYGGHWDAAEPNEIRKVDPSAPLVAESWGKLESHFAKAIAQGAGACGRREGGHFCLSYFKKLSENSKKSLGLFCIRVFFFGRAKKKPSGAKMKTTLLKEKLVRMRVIKKLSSKENVIAIAKEMTAIIILLGSCHFFSFHDNLVFYGQYKQNYYCKNYCRKWLNVVAD